ncbi:Glycine--tRNA ligase, mitochondrial 1 [Vitis vinifera]|uniref:Glycine--tRNA ligase, mitochondrial 1 n=1 Tax=Vitis vinifera TaxID=29760 RepID=A0A438D161_VITVI|nr:Glycine--tRNA ligase, mitochondrial 1 [Vitis vinifera]
MRFFYAVISPSNLRFLSRCRLFNASSPKPQESAATHVLRRNVLSMNVAVNREAFRQAVANTLERRLFYIPSFKIYRGVAGLYDYGPPDAPSRPTSSLSGVRYAAAVSEIDSQFLTDQTHISLGL